MNHGGKRMILTGMLVCCFGFLAACQSVPDAIQSDGTGLENPPAAVSALPSQPVPQSQPSDDEPETASPTGTDASLNLEIAHQADGTVVEDTFLSSIGEQLILDAEVHTGQVQNIQQYQYEMQPPSESLRQALFTAYFGDQASEAVHDTLNNVWELRNSENGGDYYLYTTGASTAGPTVPGEERFSLTYRLVNLYPFEDNLLSSVDQCGVTMPLETVFSLCDEIAAGIAPGANYGADTVRPYGNQGRRPYYEIFYRQFADGMPITAFNDLHFKVDSDGIQYIGGALYSFTPQALPGQILSLEDALSALRDQIDLVSFYGQERLTVGAISLEYIVVLTEMQQPIITPAWRFQLGAGADSRSINRVRVLAVDAVTGDLIQGERGVNF